MVRIVSVRAALVVIGLLIGSLGGLEGCGGTPELVTGNDPMSDAGPPRSDADASQGNININRDAKPADVTPNNCTPISCTNDAATYCGQIGNGCNGILDCGDCAGGQVCVQNVCSMPIDGCAPLTCAQLGGTYCGRIGDGCGRSFDRSKQG